MMGSGERSEGSVMRVIDYNRGGQLTDIIRPDGGRLSILLPFTAFADENGLITETTNGKHSYAEIKKFAGLN